MSTSKYFIDSNEGQFIIEISSDWKITFGPVAVGASKDRYGGQGSMALRIYESDTKQRAIFTGVKSFRDLSIPIQKRVITTVGEDKYEYDTEGNKKQVAKAEKQEQWIDIKIE